MTVIARPICFALQSDCYTLKHTPSTFVVQGDCEEECDDNGCKSLEEGNRRVLGFGWTPPRSEL